MMLDDRNQVVVALTLSDTSILSYPNYKFIQKQLQHYGLLTTDHYC